MQHLHRLVAFVLLSCIALAPGAAMARQDAVLAGRVVDQSGTPIAGALIKLVSIDRGEGRELRTDDKGEYLGRGFRVGDFRVTVSADGYNPESTEYRINLGMNTMDVTLSLAEVAPLFDYDRLNKLYEDAFKAYEAEDWTSARDKITELVAGLVGVDSPEAGKMTESSYEILGRAQLELQAYDEAVAAYDAILAINPGSLVANVWAGQAYTRRNQFEAALPYLRRAAELSPEDPGVQYNAGAVMLQLNDVDGGIAAIERAIQLRPEFPLAHKNLGYAYLRRGAQSPEYYDKAIEMLRTYLAQAPDAPDRADVEGMIAAIEAQIRQ